MVKKIMALIVAIYVIIGGIIALTPKKAIAKNKPIYMAGLESGGICHCPVIAGDCVCAIHLPDGDEF